MSTHQIPSAGVSGTITVPDPVKYPFHYATDFDVLEDWGAGAPGPFGVSGGIFSSTNWGPDQNHLVSKGGVGLLRLTIFKNRFEFQDAQGNWVTADFTNAPIEWVVRGSGLNPAALGYRWLPAWIQARHPTVLGKYVNWAYLGPVDYTPLIADGAWHTVKLRLTSDPSYWAWGKGDGAYDTFLSLPESLQNVCNFHAPLLGPDSQALQPPPSGTFQADRFSIAFNYNGPPPGEDPPALPGGFAVWGATGSGVGLSVDKRTAMWSATSGFSIACGSRSIVGGERKYFEFRPTAWSAGVMLGVVTAAAPLSSSYTYVGADANGVGYYRNGDVYKSASLLRSLPPFQPGDVIGVHVDGSSIWYSRNGLALHGDPALGTDPIATGLAGPLYPAASDGSSSPDTASVGLICDPSQWTYQPAAGFSPIEA